jgi:hypothetical protein
MKIPVKREILFVKGIATKFATTEFGMAHITVHTILNVLKPHEVAFRVGMHHNHAAMENASNL